MLKRPISGALVPSYEPNSPFLGLIASHGPKNRLDQRVLNIRKPEELPYVIGLVYQAFERQMHNAIRTDNALKSETDIVQEVAL